MERSVDIFIAEMRTKNSDNVTKSITNALSLIQANFKIKLISLAEIPHNCFAQIVILSKKTLDKLSDSELHELRDQGMLLIQMESPEDVEVPQSKDAFSKLDPSSSPEILAQNFQYLLEICRLRQELNEVKLRSIKQAKMASLGVMNATLAHEINNPLTIILGQVGLMKKHFPETEYPKVAEGIFKIEKTVGRITSIMKSLKFFSRDDQDDPVTQVKILDVIKNVETICDKNLNQAEIKFVIDEFEDLEFSCKDVQISQILVNLIQNSIDAIKKQEKPWIKVNCRKSKGFIYISISDSGEKISDSIAETIFDPFFTTKIKDEGTGLGLSYSKSIALEHNGDLNILTDQPNTTFELKLPI